MMSAVGAAQAVRDVMYRKTLKPEKKLCSSAADRGGSTASAFALQHRHDSIQSDPARCFDQHQIAGPMKSLRKTARALGALEVMQLVVVKPAARAPSSSALLRLRRRPRRRRSRNAAARFGVVVELALA